MLARRLFVTALLLSATPTRAHAEETGQTGVAYGIVGLEVAAAGTVAIHVYTSSSPGGGIGLALNFVPIVVGFGGGLLAEAGDLDSRPALGFHGAVVGGTALLMIGASIDGRHAKTGAKLGPASLTLGVLGAAGGAYLASTRVDSMGEALGVALAPFAGALAGGITFAIVHLFDDEGPRSTGRLLRYAGGGMLLGTAASLALSYKDRGDPAVMKPARRDLPLLSFGGSF